MLAEPAEGPGDLGDVRRHYETGAPVRHDLERPARVGRGEDRLLREECLEGDHAVVLVHGRVVDGETTRVQIGELGLADATREPRAAVQASLPGETLEPFAVRPLAGDHDLERAVAGRGLD